MHLWLLLIEYLAYRCKTNLGVNEFPVIGVLCENAVLGIRLHAVMRMSQNTMSYCSQITMSNVIINRSKWVALITISLILLLAYWCRLWTRHIFYMPKHEVLNKKFAGKSSFRLAGNENLLFYNIVVFHRIIFSGIIFVINNGIAGFNYHAIYYSFNKIEVAQSIYFSGEQLHSDNILIFLEQHHWTYGSFTEQNCYDAILFFFAISSLLS